MLIQCLIQREGPTVQHIGGQRFEFKPRPELTGGDTKANVAEIQKEEIVEYLLQNPNFRQYLLKKAETVKVVDALPKPKKKIEDKIVTGA